MKIIIVGAGKVGELLCKDLSVEGNDITLIEYDQKTLDKVLSICDIMGIVGNGANRDILEEASVSTSDIFIAVTQSDEVNIISCIMAKKIGAKYTIARVRNPEYSSQIRFMTDSLGIDMMLNPESEAAAYIAKNLEFSNALNVESFSNDKVSLVEVIIEKATYLDNIKLINFKHKYFNSVLVCVVQRGQEIFIPTGNFILKAGDKIYVTGTQEELTQFYKSLGHDEEAVGSVILIGGGRISYYLTEKLAHKKINIKLIEADSARAEVLGEKFDGLKNVVIINGDGTDRELLEEERFKEYDACVSLTGIDEENIIVSMFANKMGIKKTITKINGTSLLGVMEFSGLQTIVTPKKIIADHIIKVVRSLMTSQGEKIETLYRFVDNRVDAIEFLIEENSKIINIPLMDLPIKDTVLIPYISRNGKIIFPGGSDVIKPGDKILIVTTEKFLYDINKILK